MKKQFILIIVSIIALVSQAYAEGSSTVGPANPAAINCTKLGGQLEVTQTAEGQDANCVIEEWKLLNEMSKLNLVKEYSYTMPNPASVNCENIKGTVRIIETTEGKQGLCVIGQWDLFRAIDITQ